MNDGDPIEKARALSWEDVELVEAFRSGTIAAGDFHHEEHVRVAWACLQEYSLPEALSRFKQDLVRFATAVGSPGLYHETVTWAYLFLIHERLERQGRTARWEAFRDANPDLLRWKGGPVERLYGDRLEDEIAKRVFVMPHR